MSRIFYKVPEAYQASYLQERSQKNYKHLVIIGTMITLMQLVIYLLSYAEPFTEDVSVMWWYHWFYRMNLLVFGPMILLSVWLRRKNKVGLLKVLLYVFTFLIMGYAMGVAVFDQFQGENVVLYYVALFVVAITIDYDTVEKGLILIPVQVIFVLAMYNARRIIPDYASQINDSSQYVLVAMIINYYISELQKKNFVRGRQLIEKNKALEYLSFFDPLSNLFNRRRWEERYHEDVTRARDNRVDLGVLIIDIDYFKQFNDNYGHVAGDEVIRKISQVLLKATQGCEANVGRYGGDEFAISLYDTDQVKVRKIIRNIKTEVEALDVVHDYAMFNNRLSLSIGSYVGIPGSRQHPWSYVIEADQVLYKEKANRKLRHLSVK